MYVTNLLTQVSFSLPSNCFRMLPIVSAAALFLISQPAVLSADDTSSSPTNLKTKADLLEEFGGSERINFAGKLRMLSQRIPAAACNLNAGVSADNSAKILTAASAEFDKIMHALEHGDPSLNINGKERRGKTRAAIADVHVQWDPMSLARSQI